MATLEDRLATLEHTLSTVMRQLQQQIAEQRREYNHRFDILEKALSHQFGAINARFDTQDARSTRIEQRLDQQAADFRWKFDESNHYATETRGIVEMQLGDIREIKGRLDTLESRFDTLDNKVDSLENKMDRRFDQLVALITKQNN